MLRTTLVLFLLLMLMIQVCSNNCVERESFKSGCGRLAVYAKFKNALNFTVTLNGAMNGLMLIKVGGQKMDCKSDDLFLSCPKVYHSPVTFFITKDAVDISDSTTTERRIGVVQFSDIGQYSYVNMEFELTTETGQISIKLENGEFVKELPTEKDSGFDGFTIAGIVIGCLVALAVVVVLAWAVSVRSCCKERWANRKRCRRGRKRFLAAKSMSKSARPTPAPSRSEKMAEQQPEQQLEKKPEPQPEKKPEPTSEDSTPTPPQPSKKRRKRWYAKRYPFISYSDWKPAPITKSNPLPTPRNELRMPPSPLRNGKRPEEVAVGEYVVKSPPNTVVKFKKHQEHRKGVDTTKGYNPLPHCYFCFQEQGMMDQKRRHAEEKAKEAKEEEKLVEWAIAEAERQDKAKAARKKARAEARAKAEAAKAAKQPAKKKMEAAAKIVEVTAAEGTLPEMTAAETSVDEAKMNLTEVEAPMAEAQPFSEIESRLKLTEDSQAEPAKK